jgi:hypothetical protein
VIISVTFGRGSVPGRLFRLGLPATRLRLASFEIFPERGAQALVSAGWLPLVHDGMRTPLVPGRNLAGARLRPIFPYGKDRRVFRTSLSRAAVAQW